MIIMKKLLLVVIGCWILSLALPTGVALGRELPDAAFVSGVVGHAQTYSLSCESRSAVDWAAFWGVEISEWEFLSRLPVTDNPDTGFVGNYNDAWGAIPPASYGVHAKPVAALLRQYGLQARARRGMAWDDLRAEIADGRPVIVWIIGQMWSGRPVAYKASDGHKTTVAYFEHTMILTGYDSTYVYLVDAYSGADMTFYISAFIDSWSVLGNMAVTGPGPTSKPTPTTQAIQSTPHRGSIPPGNTYIVQRGDYLVALADQFGTTWQELARLNAIPYPYTIFPGQVLTIPSQPGSASFQLYLPLMTRKGQASR